MIATRRRVPVLFAFDVRDCIGANGKIIARSYGTELEGVFTRAGVKWMADQNGLLVPRVHSMPPLGCVHDADGALVQGLLLEPSRTNLVTRSQEFNLWAVQSGASVSANAATAPDGTLTADLVTGGGGAESGVYVTPTFTGDGTKAHSIFLKAGTSTRTDILSYDTVSSAGRRRCTLTWTGGVPVASASGGSGDTPVVEALGDGWYRVSFANGAVTAANATRYYIYPHNEAPYTGSVYVWGAQAEDASVPSSYIPTAGATVTRAADSLSFDHDALPQELTMYVRGIEQAMYAPAPGLVRRALHIGAASLGTKPYLSLGKDSIDNIFTQYTDLTVGALAQAAPSVAVPGDLVEHSGHLYSNWQVRSRYSLNGGAEVASAPTGASGPSTTWGGARIHLTGGSITTNNGAFAYQQIVVAAGDKMMDEMRALAGVA